MSDKLRDRILKASPGLAEQMEKHEAKANLATALRALRKSAGMTQVDVQKASGLSQSHISKVEAATGPIPSTETIIRYARACNARPRIEFVPEDQAGDMRQNDFISMAMLG